jgi:hypothetical protein
MASWEDLRAYVQNNYKIAKDDGALLSLVFETGGGRSQTVLIARNDTGGGIPFATIASAVGAVSELPLAAVLAELSEYVVGGAVIYGDLLMVRHSVPLVNLDVNEFVTPLDLVLNTADLLEQKYLEHDRF